MNLVWWFKVEKGTIIFQRDEFDNYYRSVLNGGKYVDPDCREDIDTPYYNCLLYTSPSPRDYAASRMPSSA